MRKLNLIKDALILNPNVTIVTKKEDSFDKLGIYDAILTEKLFHLVNFSVAPKNGLYTVNELQAFMNNLIPNINPTSMNQFSQYRTSIDYAYDEGRLVISRATVNERFSYVHQQCRKVSEEVLSFGRLYFDDIIATIDSTMCLNSNLDKSQLRELNLLNFERLNKSKTNLIERTIIGIYPDEDVAKDVLSYSNREFTVNPNILDLEGVLLKYLEKYRTKKNIRAEDIFPRI